MLAPSSTAWYKDAVIYEVHVRAFHDGNGDGVGDFRGLIDKLDYLQELGVTALWLLPFYPSPLRDDGYDISDYRQVHPSYGSLRDFRLFLREAHRRGIRVITELVLAHTSDEHPWFQRARLAKPGSVHRDFYVWSDTPDRFAGARIIFKDFESSNWSFDPVAQAYFWHRFYSHQPSLNYDNPAVRQAMLDVVDYWLSMGVDGLRLDAVPYLYAREGTDCENLPRPSPFSGSSGPTSTVASTIGCCWPRPTSGPKMPWRTWAGAIPATWPSIFPSCPACSWRPARRTGSPWWTSWRRRPPPLLNANGPCSCAITTS